MPKCPQFTLTSKEISARWGVTERTARRWRDYGYPVDDDLALAYKILTLKKIPMSAVTKAREIVSAERANNPQPEPEPKPGKAGKRKSDLPSAPDLEALRNHLWAQMIDADSPEQMDYCRKAFLEVEGTYRSRQLAEARLGIKDGRLIPQEELERLFRAMAAAAVSSFHDTAQAISPSLAATTSPEKVYHELRKRFAWQQLFRPMIHAAKSKGAGAVPQWVTGALTAAVEDYAND